MICLTNVELFIRSYHKPLLYRVKKTCELLLCVLLGLNMALIGFNVRQTPRISHVHYPVVARFGKTNLSGIQHCVHGIQINGISRHITHHALIQAGQTYRLK